MSIEKAEELAHKVYTQWSDKQCTTSRARELLNKLPHCETVDMIWNTISYFGVKG